jgi:hypothetical protein
MAAREGRGISRRWPNLEAAEQLDKLVEEIAQLKGSDVHRRIDALIDQTNEEKRDDIRQRLHEDVSAKLRSTFSGRISLPEGREGMPPAEDRPF